jgi:hypothetical protein
MRIRHFGAFLALAALAAAPAARAQVAQVGVTVQLLYNVESIYAADFVPENVGQQPDFLSIILQNGSGQGQNIVLEVSIRQERPRSAELFRGTTDPFLLGPGARRITNRDLSNENSDVAIESYDISSDLDELNDQIRESGQLPAGSYLVQVTALRAPIGTVLGRGEVRLELVNPTRVELLTPGGRFGETPEIVQTANPRFQWSVDQGLASAPGTYQLRVAAVEGAASPEEAMQAYPSWETITNATTALYPGSVSAIPLEPGKTYAWQVKREVRSSGGSVFLESPIFWFKMAGGEDAEGSEPAGELGAALQLDELARALGLGGQLQGFRPTGQMTVDGKTVSGDTLETLLRAILAGQVTVHSVTVR